MSADEATQLESFETIKDADIADVAYDAAFSLRCIIRNEQYDYLSLQKMLFIIQNAIKTISIPIKSDSSRDSVRALVDPIKAKAFRHALTDISTHSPSKDREKISLVEFLVHKGEEYSQIAGKITENENTASPQELEMLEDFCLALAKHSENRSVLFHRRPLIVK